MKLVFILIFVFAVHTATIYSQRVTLIGSHLLPADSSFKSFLSTNNLKGGSSVDVSLLASNAPTNKNLRVSGGETFDEVQFENVPQSIDYELKVPPKSSNKCSSAKLIKSSDRPLIFIQYAKPFYKIGEDFSFRVFALSQKMLPYNGRQPINIKILDSRNEVVEKFDNIQITNFGVYEGSLKLPTSQNLGKWKIQVESAERKVTKKFNVAEPNKDNLEIFLEMSPALAYSDKKAFLNVYIKDRSNKFFTGIAKIFVSGRLIGSNRDDFNRKLVKTVELAGPKNGFGISYDEEIGLSPPSDMILKFDVEIIEPATQKFITTSKKVELKSNSRNTIHLVKKRFFKPGFKYPMKVKVKTLDGAPDNSFNQLSMSVEYHNKGRGIDKKEFQLNLKNGEISAPLNPTADTTQIVVNLAFAGAKLTEVIKPLPTMGANEYMQVTVLKKGNTIGDKVKYQALTTGEMESLHVLLIGINGIVHYEEFPDATGKDIFEFSIELIEEMKPEARGIAFYVRPSDGVLVYDEFVLSLTFGIENLLEISAPETGKPNEQINIDVKTLPGAKVFLTASDQVSPLVIRDNEISRTDIYNELIYYLNYRFPNTSLYNFEKFNGFILQPLTDENTCSRGSARYSNYESDDEDEDPTEAQYFPKVWFDKSFDAASSTTSVPVKLPNSLTTWRYYGISVHPTKGFTVAKIQPKTAVKNEIIAQVKAPPSAYKSEIVWVDVNVFNTLQDSLRSDVFVSIENGFMVDLKTNNEFGQKCTKFSPRNKKDDKTVSNLLPQKKTEVFKIPIKSNGNGDMKVKVRAVAGNYNEEATKTIVIQPAEEIAHTNNNFETKINTQELQNNQAKIEIEVKVLRMDVKLSSIIVLDVELPRGYKYVSHDQSDKIDGVELQSDLNLVIFHLKNLRPNQVFRQAIKVSKAFDFDNHSPSAVITYDYDHPDTKDVSYYSYDKNTESCDRIEVIRWTNKAKGAQRITQEAQRSVQKSLGKVAEAQKMLTAAQNKLKQAEQNVKAAEENAIVADMKSQEAFNIAEDAWRAAEQAKQYKPENVIVTNPSNSIDEPSDETPLNAADAQRIAKEAQKLATQAQEEAVEAEDDVTIANEKVEAARAEVQKALNDLNEAQNNARDSKDEADKSQIETKTANKNVGIVKNNLKKAQKDAVDVQTAVNKAADRVNEIKHDVDNALSTVNDAVNKANKATRYTDIEQDILNAEIVSEKAKGLAQNANQVENTIIQQIQQPIIAINKEVDNVQILQDYCNGILARANAANTGAMHVQRTINIVTVSFGNGQKQFLDARRKLEEAQTRAKFTSDKATRLREYSQLKSQEANRLANLETTTQRKTQRPTQRPTQWSTQRTPTINSWQPSPSWPNQGRTYPSVPTTTTTQPTRNDNVHYPNYNTNHEIPSASGSDAIACQKWYRFCDFGF